MSFPVLFCRTCCFPVFIYSKTSVSRGFAGYFSRSGIFLTENLHDTVVIPGSEIFFFAAPEITSFQIQIFVVGFLQDLLLI